MTAIPRLDTKLESDAAEFLVLGRLLLERVPTYKLYVNYPGYDLIAVNSEGNTSARIQVKSRYRTDWDGFIIKNRECDFVVFVALNRGYAQPKKSGDKGVREPEFYVMPISYVNKVRDPKTLGERLCEIGWSESRSLEMAGQRYETFCRVHRKHDHFTPRCLATYLSKKLQAPLC